MKKGPEEREYKERASRQAENPPSSKNEAINKVKEKTNYYKGRAGKTARDAKFNFGSFKLTMQKQYVKPPQMPKSKGVSVDRDSIDVQSFKKNKKGKKPFGEFNFKPQKSKPIKINVPKNNSQIIDRNE